MKLMNFARSLSFELSRDLQCLAFSTHLPIRCLKGRDFSDSVPVRYIPKNKRNGGSGSLRKKLDEKGSRECAHNYGVKFEGSSGCGGFGGGEFVDDKSGWTRECVNSSGLNSESLSGRGGFRRDEVVDDKSRWTRDCADKDGLGNESFSGSGGFRRGEVVDDGLRNQDRVMPVKKMMFKGNLQGFWTGEIVGEREVSLEENRVQNDNVPDLGLTGQNLESLDYELAEETEEVEELKDYKNHRMDEVDIGKTKQDAEKLAVELLAMRGYTAVELRKKLHAKKFSHAIIDEVLDNFQNRGLINDNLYAETFSRSRWSSLTWGPRRIKQALFKKGISGGDAEKAIKLVFEDGDCDGDQELKLGMSKVSMDRLIVQASKQWLRGRDVPRETRKSRIIRWLQYRGFKWNVISFVIKKLEAQHSP